MSGSGMRRDLPCPVSLRLPVFSGQFLQIHFSVLDLHGSIWTSSDLGRIRYPDGQLDGSR